MAKTVRGQDLGRAVVESLQAYTDEVAAAIRKEVDAAANDINKGIQAAAPVGRTGRYRKGWSITKRDTTGVTSRTVHNKRVPGLPHLLEHGHAKRGGGRVPGRAHIAPTVEPRLREMEANIKQIIEKSG